MANVDLRLSLIEKYARLHKQGENCDVTFLVEGQKIKAHRLVFAVQSDLLRDFIFNKHGNNNEILMQVPLAPFQILLNFMYTGTMNLAMHSVWDLSDVLELSFLYEMQELLEALSNYLVDTADLQNVQQILQVAASRKHDVEFEVQGEKFPAHRIVFAASSDYFRILVFGHGFMGAHLRTVTVEAPLAAFKILHNFIYTGNIQIAQHSILDVADLFLISHRFGIDDLKEAVSEYLNLVVDLQNANKVLETATIAGDTILQQRCRVLMGDLDENA